MVLSHSIDMRSKQQLVDSLDGVRDQARLNSLSLCHAGDWLNAIPSKNLDLHLDPQEFRINALYRLGIPVFNSPGPCIGTCRQFNDAYGDHAISCAMEGETIVRHNALRDDLHRCAITAGLTSRREVRRLLPGNDARPADVFIHRWIRRRDTAFDVTVINPLQRATVDRAAAVPGHALEVFSKD